jgi:transposase
MLPMINKYNIKTMHELQGKSLRVISKETGHSFRTVKKYATMEDFNVKLKPRVYSSKLDPFKETIFTWLQSDLDKPLKQRHTARKIHDRLKNEFIDECDVSYKTIANFVSKARKTINNPETHGMTYLKHSHGEAQLDFGATTYIHNGELVKGYHLVVTFPYSNHGYVQLFPAQNQEALFAGMKNIFEYIGKVPKEIWFDNMSTAVIKVKKNGKRILTDDFYRFAAHYGFQAKFCNPASGNEKGSVENKVGYFRRNLFVPIPEIKDLNEFNINLLLQCDEDSKRVHYLKQTEIFTLFQEEINGFLPLNRNPYEVFKILKAKTNKMGYVNFKKNIYSVLPKLKNQEVWIKYYYDYIEILDEEYNLLTKHKRSYSKNIKYTNWKEWIEVLKNKPRSFENTELFDELPQSFRTFFISKTTYDEKRNLLSLLGEFLIKDSIEVAIEALEENISKGIQDIESFKTSYRAKLEPSKIYDPLKLKDDIPKITEFEIDLAQYDRLMGGAYE